jgi:hypothetical protein
MSIVQVCIYDQSVQIKTQQSKPTLQRNEPNHKHMQTHAWHPEYHFSSWIQLVTAPCLDSHVTFDSLLQMLCKTNSRWQKQTKQRSNSWQNKLLPHLFCSFFLLFHFYFIFSQKKELRALKYLDMSSALTVAQIPFCERIQEAYSNQIHHQQATTTKSKKNLCSKKETHRTKSCQVDDIPHTNQHRKPHKQKRLK